MTTYSETITTPIGTFLLEADEDALVSIKLHQGKAIKSHPNWVTNEANRQIRQYFDKKRDSFDVPLKALGTEFQKRVWDELLKTGFGTTKSYSDIAHALGKAGAQRAVGLANRLNPLPIIVPCHRIIGKNGALTGYALGLNLKQWLLNHEKCR